MVRRLEQNYKSEYRHTISGHVSEQKGQISLQFIIDFHLDQSNGNGHNVALVNLLSVLLQHGHVTKALDNLGQGLNGRVFVMEQQSDRVNQTVLLCQLAVFR